MSQDTREGLALRINLSKTGLFLLLARRCPECIRGAEIVRTIQATTNRLLESVELIPVIIDNYSTPRPATETESKNLEKSTLMVRPSLMSSWTKWRTLKRKYITPIKKWRSWIVSTTPTACVAYWAVFRRLKTQNIRKTAPNSPPKNTKSPKALAAKKRTPSETAGSKTVLTQSPSSQRTKAPNTTATALSHLSTSSPPSRLNLA